MNLFLFFLLVVQIHSVTPVIHTLQYFQTASSQVPNFPEYVSVGYVDGVEISYYDSNIRKTESKQDWMNKITAEDPKYWQIDTEINVRHELIAKHNLEVRKKRFNQTGGVHIVQWMYGCEWNDETDEVKGWQQEGYDGEDYISLDMKTWTYTAAKPQAFPDKLQWDQNIFLLDDQKYYYTEECPSYLKKYVKNGKKVLMIHLYLHPHLLSIFTSIHTFSLSLLPSTPSLHLYLHPHLLSIFTSIHTFSPFPPSTPSLHLYLHPHLLSIFTSIHTFSPRCLLFTRDITSCAELPEVFLLQKTPSSPVTCMATGFYPDLADLFWRKDGEQIFEDVEHGELLPNHDGTFQMSVELKVEVTAEVEGKYECVFQLSGVKEDLVTKLERRSILSNASHEDNWSVALAATAAVVAVAAVLAAIIIVMVRRHRNTGDATGAGKDCALAIVPVRVKAGKGNRYVQTYAFLDPGSTATFCTENLMNQLKVKGRKTEIILRTIGQETPAKTYEVRGLEVGDLEGFTSLDLPKVYTQSKIPVSKKNIITKADLKRWSYLGGIDLKEIEADIELLIGTDVPQAMEPWNIINSQKNGPYAVQTILGWVVTGPLSCSATEHAGPIAVSTNRISVFELKDLLIRQYNQDFSEKIFEEKNEMSVEDNCSMEIASSSMFLKDGHDPLPLPFRDKDKVTPQDKFREKERHRHSSSSCSKKGHDKDKEKVKKDKGDKRDKTEELRDLYGRRGSLPFDKEPMPLEADPYTFPYGTKGDGEDVHRTIEKEKNKKIKDSTKDKTMEQGNI
nr:uncharacterized protein LOC133609140 [Nerophis lumbriciformis]